MYLKPKQSHLGFSGITTQLQLLLLTHNIFGIFCRFWPEPFRAKDVIEGCREQWGVEPRPLWATIEASKGELPARLPARPPALLHAVSPVNLVCTFLGSFPGTNAHPNRRLAACLQWGGKRIESASNIVFSNGLLDPWSGGGVLHNISDSLVAVIIPEGGWAGG